MPRNTTRHRYSGMTQGGVTRRAYQTWIYHRDNLCRRWANSFLLFWEECYKQRPKSGKCTRLYAPDVRSKLSPRNFRWGRKTKQGLIRIDECCRALIALGTPRKEARERAESVSRQRRSQIVSKAKRLGLLFNFRPY